MKQEFKPKLSFEILNSKDFLEKLINEYDDFDKEHLNSRHAINCAINSWHLTDWTFQEFHKNDSRFRKTNIDNKKESELFKYQNYLKEVCPELEYMRIIANGIKHCKISLKGKDSETLVSPGDYSQYDYSRHDYLVPKFIIKLENNKEIDFESVLLKTIDFWKTFINDLYQN